MAGDLKAVLAEAQALLPDIVRLRRRIHRCPEVGLALPETQRTILDALADLNLDITTGSRLSSIVAILNGRAPGRTVLLRADMDALKMREATGLDYASEIDGAMHACGHDCHAAMLVGAARLLSARRQDFSGRIIFAFQPGEEGYAGARMMIEEGLLDRHGAPDAAFAIHISPTDSSGEVATRSGPAMAGAGTFRILVQGRGGHPALPHRAIDPIPVAAEIVLALQTYVTRRVRASEPAIVTVTAFQSGSAEVGAIPATATLTGTIRAVCEETRLMLFSAVRSLADHIAAAHGAQAQVDIEEGYPPVVNHPDVVDAVAETCRQAFGKERFRLLPAPIMPSEDFSYILARIPGAIAFLGARLEGKDPPANVHTPQFTVDESAMAVGVALHSAVALRLLERAPP
jgi:hippurate hydrolase